MYFSTVVAVLLLLLPSANAATPLTLVATVESVCDGHTIMPITSNCTKLRIRLLGTDALEIVHGTIPCPALALLRVSWELATERSGASRPRRAPLKGRDLD